MTDKSNVLVELKDVKKEFVTAKTFMGKPLKTVHAVDQVNLSIYETDVRVSQSKNQITFELKMKDY